jgi:hemerythrin superfamily protein
LLLDRLAPPRDAAGVALTATFLMPITQEKSMATSTKNPSTESKAQDAIALLMADHKKVKALFSQFKKLRDRGGSDEKSAIVEQICAELKIHAAIEEEIFYPAVRAAIDDSDLMDEALVEHAGAKELIAQLEDTDPDEELYDAKVTVLGEQINHHVEEEEGDMFPKVKKSKLDTGSLGAKMLERQTELKTEMGVSDDESTMKQRKRRASTG